MEKSVGIGLNHLSGKFRGMKQIDPKQCSPLVLAYVGDCVFDLIVKTMVVGRGNRPIIVFMRRRAGMSRHRHSPI